MKYKHIKFTPKPLVVDTLVINPNISPEMESISIKSIDYVAFRQRLPKAMGVTNSGIEWFYIIENESKTKELLRYEADDLYNISELHEVDNQEKIIKEIAHESFKKFSDNFDVVKIEHGLKERYLEISESEIDHFYSSLHL